MNAKSRVSCSLGLLFVLLALILPACSRSGAGSPAANLRLLTGAPSRMVWVEQVDGKGDDPLAKGIQLRLVGLDTEDGRGERVILEKVGNYRKPLITPDGRRVVYTDYTRRRIMAVNWEGGEPALLWSGGICAEVWKDPASGTTWVYALDNNSPDRDHEGRPMVRFDLDDPGRNEMVWDLTLANSDNFQLTREGTRAAGLFPWNHAGVAKLPNGGFTPVGRGCWPSMCPDNSGMMWFFDGVHKNLMLLRGPGLPSRRIPVNTMEPDTHLHEVYHPRWSNHPRFMVITGPYKNAGERSNITGGGKDIHAYAGMFNTEFTRVEKWVRVSGNHNANFYPDLWVQGGEGVESGVTAEPPAAAPPVGAAQPWPGDRKGLVFLWENAKSANEIRHPEKDTLGYCKAVRVGMALHGRFHEMVVGPGIFKTQDVPVNPVEEILRSGKFTIEFTAWPQFASSKGRPVFAFAGKNGFPILRIFQLQDHFHFRCLHDGLDRVDQPLAKIQAGKPAHVVIIFDGEKLGFFQNGKVITEFFVEGSLMKEWTVGDLLFGHAGDGQPGWFGRLEGIAVYNRALDSAGIAARYTEFSKRFADRKPATRLVARCRLLETSNARAPEELQGYRHDLVEYKYRIEEVVSGPAPEEKEILVQHWSVMDLKSVLEPREAGKVYELTLEPVAEHPELEGERVSSRMSDPLEQWLHILPIKP